jgi:hypothetical protein
VECLAAGGRASSLQCPWYGALARLLGCSGCVRDTGTGESGDGELGRCRGCQGASPGLEGDHQSMGNGKGLVIGCWDWDGDWDWCLGLRIGDKYLGFGEG